MELRSKMPCPNCGSKNTYGSEYAINWGVELTGGCNTCRISYSESILTTLEKLRIKDKEAKIGKIDYDSLSSVPFTFSAYCPYCNTEHHDDEIKLKMWSGLIKKCKGCGRKFVIEN